MISPRSLPRVGIVFRPQLPPERLRDFLGEAEAGGLDDVWIWEDCFLEGGLTTATAALSWTGSARIGLGLMPVPFRNPALAAMEIATLARLFPGRFAPAAGHGYLPWMAQVGARASAPMTLLREWVTAVRALLHGQRLTVAGEYVRLDDVALDWPPRDVPPLLVGGRGPKTVALAGELADGMVLDVGFTVDGVRQAVATAAAARPHDVVAYLLCADGPDARQRVEAELPESELPLAERAAVGPPEHVADVVRSFVDAGATTVVLQPTASDPDVAATIRLAAATRAILRDDAHALR